jgi:hypothetical protein
VYGDLWDWGRGKFTGICDTKGEGCKANWARAAAARCARRRVLIVNTGTEDDLVAAFASLAEQRVSALLVGSDAFFWAVRDQVISLGDSNSLSGKQGRHIRRAVELRPRSHG